MITQAPLVGFEPMNSPSILLLQVKEVPFELELIGMIYCLRSMDIDTDTTQHETRQSLKNWDMTQ